MPKISDVQVKFFNLLHLAIGKASGVKEQTSEYLNENELNAKKTHQDSSEDTLS